MVSFDSSQSGKYKSSESEARMGRQGALRRRETSWPARKSYHLGESLPGNQLLSTMLETLRCDSVDVFFHENKDVETPRRN